MANITNQMAFFEACEIGDIMTARDLIRDVDQSSLKDWRTPEAKTCLHGAVLAGNPDFLRELVAKIHAELPELIKKADNQGNTALHLALRNDREELVKDRVDLMKQMAELDVNLCDCANNEGETPLKLAVCLGFEEAVVFLITRTSNALHYIVELNQVKLIGNLIKRKVDLSELINQPYQPATNSPDQENYATNPSDNNDNRSTNSQHVQPNVSADGGDRPSQSAARRKKKGEDKKPTNSTDRDTQDYQPIVRQGDTPLHIAARNKYENMVNLLLKVPGANKLARNSEDKTPFEIAREVTEYYESFRIIRDLAYHRMQPKPFMHCTPKASITKNNNARLFIKKAYEERRNSELVVAALLATLTCAAAFTVPGGFDSDNDVKKYKGSPILMSSISFKLFIIFNCMAFYKAMFVCIMWETSLDFSTGNKMLFMSITTMMTCWSFGLTAFGFTSAVYAMLAPKVKIFSWVIAGYLISMAVVGGVTTIGLGLHIGVKRARFHRLCGGSCILDEIAEDIWIRAERSGLLDFYRLVEKFSHELIIGHVKFGGHHHEHEDSNSLLPVSQPYSSAPGHELLSM